MSARCQIKLVKKFDVDRQKNSKWRNSIPELVEFLSPGS